MGKDGIGPTTADIEHLTDWDKLKTMLDAARGNKATPPQPSVSLPEKRSAPSLEELDKVADWEKLRSMFTTREKSAQSPDPLPAPSPEPARNSMEPREAVREVPSPPAPVAPPVPAAAMAARQDLRKRQEADWALRGVTRAAAAFLGQDSSMATKALVYTSLVGAASTLFRQSGQEQKLAELEGAYSRTSIGQGKESLPDEFRRQMENNSETAGNLFGSVDSAWRNGARYSRPPEMREGRTMEKAMLAAGRAVITVMKTGKEPEDFVRISRENFSLPRGGRDSGLRVERGMRREGGDRVRVMGGF